MSRTASTRRAPYRSPSRAAAAHETDGRKAWLPLLADARAVAAVVGGGGVWGKLQAAPFAHRVITLRAPFPVRQVSARSLAEAFLIVARAFVANGHPPALARSLGALADDLGALIEAETRAAFAQSCRVTGEAGE